MKLIGYIRVSKEIQEISPEVQRKKIQSFCELYGHEVEHWIEDIGGSGRSLKRPGFQHAMRLLDSRKSKGIIVAKLDRLTRSLADWQVLITRYFSKTVTLLAVDDCVSTKTASGRLVLNMLMTVAQWERETISERTKAALHEKRERGERVGQVPYGWTLDPTDSKRLVPVEEQQQVIDAIRIQRDGGCGFQQIADALNYERIPTNGAYDPTKLWTATKVRRILKRLESLCGKE